MALTKVITGVTDLNQAQSTNGLKFPTGSVFAGTPEEGMIRNDQSQSSETSSSTMQFYNGTAWKNFVNKTPIPLGSDNFNTVLYTGNNGTQSITGVGFQPDFTWIKARDNGSNNHALTDSVRGTGSGNGLSSNTTGAEGQYSAAYGYLSAFGTDGFTVQAGSTSPNFVNSSSANYVSWSWKAGGAPTATNSAGAGNVPTSGSVMIDGVASTATLAGSIAATEISANTAAGFSIVSYTGNGSTSQTYGHGLDSIPEMIITKNTSGSEYWPVWNKDLTSVNYFLYLNTTDAEGDGVGTAFNSGISSTLIGIGSSGLVNTSSQNYITYAFHSVAGYSKIGSYTGNGSTTGPTIVTGFEPAWVMVKRTDNTSAWNIQDNKRNTTNPRTSVLQASSSDQEYTSSTYAINFNTNDFQIVNSDNGWNTSGGTYIYMAFAAT